MTNKSNDGQSSLIDALVSKFNLNKSDVQSVFDEHRQAQQAERETERLDTLKQALADKKLTQAQYDHILQAWEDIDER